MLWKAVVPRTPNAESSFPRPILLLLRDAGHCQRRVPLSTTAIGIDTHGVEGERYLYLPSMFFCIWLVYVLQQVFQLKKTVLIIGVCCCMGIVFLFQARSYYVKSGKITQQTVQAMQQLTGKEKIFFSNLPQYNKGAVVLRRG